MTMPKRLQRTGISVPPSTACPLRSCRPAAEAQRWMPREGFEYEANNTSLDNDVLLVGFLRLHDSRSAFGKRAESEDVKERHKYA